MAEFRPGSPDQTELLEALIDAGHLIPSGVDGVYGRGSDYEDVRQRFDAYVTRVATAAGETPEVMRFPPVLPRKQIEDLGYLENFPHLAGSVFAFEGSEAEARAMAETAGRHEDWSAHQHQSDLCLTPAVCYPVYPAVGRRGVLPAGGVTIDPGASYAFRHEPSGDPARLQMFHMRELVRIAEPEVVQTWRDGWRDRALTLLRALGLDANFDVASDPFFGRSGRMMAASQREQALKFEILVQIAGPEPTAVASFNYHQDHFSGLYGIKTADGGEAHTACLGFGHERIVLALLKTHGLDVAGWPAPVRAELWG
ncbi:MAG TPA: amino acid--[acyl-carrier-protein] ligase [Baekduia sp.]|nr:amino acid--[acyl-carrier-protein] ligase [Baekduia sp.]